MNTKDKWVYKSHKFDFQNECRDYTWFGHSCFVYDLVFNYKPKLIVELGTYYGTSIFSFCQAIKDYGFDTKVCAIDLWKGDINSGFYLNDVYKFVKHISKKYYNEVDLNLMKMSFDDAVSNFEDNSIDILHIDGEHTYEAVLNDYNKWKGKVSLSGILLFHDICVKEFGVRKVFDIAKKENSKSLILEFEHNYGLGVIIKSPKLINKIKLTQNFMRDYSKKYILLAKSSLSFDGVLSIQKDRDNRYRKVIELKNKLRDKIKSYEAEIKNRDSLWNSELKKRETLWNSELKKRDKIWRKERDRLVKDLEDKNKKQNNKNT